MRGIQRDHNIFNADDISAGTFLRSADSALIVKEEDIIYLLENRIKTNISSCAYRCCQCAEIAWISFLNGRSALRIGPAEEFAAGLFRCSRRINLLTGFDFLLRNDLSICIIEIIGCDCRLLFTCDDINGKLA